MTKISPASGTSVTAPAIGSVGAMPSTIIAHSLRCGASNGERSASRGKNSATLSRPAATTVRS